MFFYKDLNIKHPISTQQHVEKIAPNMFKDKTLLLPFIAFNFITHSTMDVYDEYAFICY